MTQPDLETLFPNLRATPYSVTSPEDPRYNCIAWAVGDTRRWWQRIHLNGYHWPPELKRDDTLESWILLFTAHRYQVGADESFEPEHEKVAIYVAETGQPSHVARQNENGTWTSKLGKLQDVEHADLRGLEGDAYGRVSAILRRRRL